jgi:2-iminobutanoate/2-iminopropanoate deaminase
MAVIDARG